MKNIVVTLGLFLTCCFFSRAQSGIITTLAGNGYNNDTGNGGYATAASICGNGISAPDSLGNWYISEVFCYYIRKISIVGIINEFSGNGFAGDSGDGGPASGATLYDPQDMVFDSRGNLYVSESRGARVRTINASTSIITTFAGNGSRSMDTGDGGPASVAAIGGANGSCFDKYGNFFFGSILGRVKKVDAVTHVITTVVGGPFAGTFFEGAPATAVIIPTSGVFVDTDDNLYIPDGSLKIYKVDAATQRITTFAGNDTGVYNGEGVPATAAGIYPFRITGDSYGNIFIADRRNNRIRKITAANRIYTVAGIGVGGFYGDGGLADSAELMFPENVVLDACGNLFVSDNGNFRIRKVTFPQTPPTAFAIVAGSTLDYLCYGMPITFYSSFTTTGYYKPSYQWKVNGSSVGSNTPTFT